MVGTNLRWPASRVAGFGLEFVFLPFRLLPHGFLVSGLDHDFVTRLGDAAEGSIRVYKMIGIEAGIHDLAVRKHVMYRPIAQDNHHSGEHDDHPSVSHGGGETTRRFDLQNHPTLRIE